MRKLHFWTEVNYLLGKYVANSYDCNPK